MRVRFTSDALDRAKQILSITCLLHLVKGALNVILKSFHMAGFIQDELFICEVKMWAV